MVYRFPLAGAGQFDCSWSYHGGGCHDSVTNSNLGSVSEVEKNERESD